MRSLRRSLLGCAHHSRIPPGLRRFGQPAEGDRVAHEDDQDSAPSPRCSIQTAR